MSFLEDGHLDGLKIDRMILHVISPNDDFELQDEITDLSQSDFFLDRIRANATSAVHAFNEGSSTKTLLASIFDNENKFVEHAQELSRRFKKSHAGNTSNGAFFVILMSCDGADAKYVCLVKYDYRQAIELYQEEGQSALRKIVQAFVQERAAIQKFCMARYRAGTVEAAVSAFDRNGTRPDLTGYFSSFLDVERSRDDKELSKQLREAIRETLEKCKELLPEQDEAAAYSIVSDVLRGRDIVEPDDVLEAIATAAKAKTDSDERRQLQNTLNRRLRSKNLEGISFHPNQGIFARKPRRRIETNEGVRVDFPGALEGGKVRISQNPVGGGSVITITTEQEFTKNGTVSEGAKRGD